jgi:hypothetical protein
VVVVVDDVVVVLVVEVVVVLVVVEVVVLVVDGGTVVVVVTTAGEVGVLASDVAAHAGRATAAASPRRGRPDTRMSRRTLATPERPCRSGDGVIRNDYVTNPRRSGNDGAPSRPSGQRGRPAGQ